MAPDSLSSTPSFGNIQAKGCVRACSESSVVTQFYPLITNAKAVCHITSASKATFAVVKTEQVLPTVHSNLDAKELVQLTIWLDSNPGIAATVQDDDLQRPVLIQELCSNAWPDAQVSRSSATISLHQTCHSDEFAAKLCICCVY